MKKRIWSLILVVVLLATIGLTAVGCDDPTDPWAEPAYFSELYVYNGTAWVELDGTGSGGGGGGGGLWEVDGTETQLILADDIDIQNQSLLNVLYIDGVSVVTLNATVEGHTTQVVGLINNVTALQLLSHTQNTDTGLGALGVKNPPIDADKVIYRDSTAGDALVTSTWTQVKAFLKTYFDTVYDATGTAAAAVNAHSALTTGVHGVTGTVLGTEDVDDVAVDGATTAPISSNWAYDHASNGSIHTTITTAAMTLYVDAGAGNDANDGSSGSPKATIQGALDALPVVIAHIPTIKVRGPQNYPEGNVQIDFSRFDTLTNIVIKAVNANDEDMYDNGVADAGAGNNELDDATKAWSVDQFNGAYVWIYEGTGAGQIRTISDTTATKLTVSVNWAVNPDATSYYAIGGGATMTGVCGYHLYNSGKKVNVYGLKHTGATTYDMRYDGFASGGYFYNYDTGVRGLNLYNFPQVSVHYNYMDVTAVGMYLNAFANVLPRANVVKGATYGVYIDRNSIAIMQGNAGLKNYFDTCTTGIHIQPTQAGCEAASVQVFNGCGTNIFPAVSSGIPQWYT